MNLAQSPAVRLGEGWLLTGGGEPGAQGDPITGRYLFEGSRRIGQVELDAGSSTTPGQGPGQPGANVG